MVVFCVADADRVVDRGPQCEEGLAQSGGFRHCLGEDHQSTAIERQNQGLLERANHLENRAGPLAISLHHGLTGREGYASSLKLSEKGWTGHVSDDYMPTARGELEHGAILSDDHIEAGQVSGDAMEIRQPAPRDQDHHDPVPTRLADRVPYSEVEHAVDGDGAIVVESKGGEFHGSKISLCAGRIGFPAANRRFSGSQPKASGPEGPGGAFRLLHRWYCNCLAQRSAVGEPGRKSSLSACRKLIEP